MDLNFVKEGIPRSDINQSNKDWLTDTYWNAMAYMDRHVGEVITSLKEQGLYEETLIVFLGDHGEELFDSGLLGHGHNINKAQLHIPLVLSAPDMAFDNPVGLSDIYGWLDSYTNPEQNTAVKYGECVFLYTGDFLRPAQVGQICGTEAIPEVYTIAFDQYSGPKNKATMEAAKTALVHTWETALFEDMQP